ncbi:MAG: hypothetical protein N2234_04815, partial [Planctomycetota bacterium]|nr:hypothetical protein [Planctomycetota bacterium]
LREAPSTGLPSVSSISGKEQLSKEELKRLVKEAVSERVEPVLGKIALDDFSIRLNLSAAEKDSLEHLLRSKKESVKNLLLTPRADGSNLLDDMANELIPALQTEGEEGARRVFIKFFGRIMKENVPGMEKTYFEEAQRIKEETKNEMRRLLGAEKYNGYLAMQIEDPLDKIKIPDDPIELYLFKKMQEKGVAPPPPQPGQ